VPSPAAPPSGCRFHTRCWLREKLGNPDECVTIDPQLRTIDTGHEVACHFAEKVDGSPEQLQATGRASASTPAAPGTAPASAIADERPADAVLDATEETPTTPPA
jgi:peptide/nickel transport system ATP-binding protein